MWKLEAKNKKNEILQLTNSKWFEVINMDGLLPPTASINSAVVSTNDGEIFNSIRVPKRELSIDFAIKHPIEANRLKLYEFFKLKSKVRLYYSNGTRQVYIDGYVESYDGSLFNMMQIITVNVVCLDPYFKNRASSVAENSMVLDNFTFPFDIEEIGQEFSIIDHTLTQTVVNGGEVATGIIIELIASGEVVNPIIYNVDTRESYGINITMQLGDVIKISTVKNDKHIELIRAGETSNIINKVMPKPTWFSLSAGDNIFTYACTSGEEFLKVRFTHTDMYAGV